MDFTLKELAEYKIALRKVKASYIKKYGIRAKKWFGV